MKKTLSLLTVIAGLALAAVLTITCCCSSDLHCDFNLRINELSCVRQRVNPYDVWSEKVELKPFYPNTHKGEIPEGCDRQVNAYAPWAYVFMYPIAVLPKGVDWFVYCVLMALAIAVTLWLVNKQTQLQSRQDRMLLAILPFLVVAHSVFSNCLVGNFALFVLLGVVVVAWGCNRGNQLVAGLGWALAMVKPQLALLLAIPLLYKRCFVTCFIAAGLCLLASVVMSRVLNSPLIDLLLQGPTANTEFFHGCGTWPKFLCECLGVEHDIVIGMVVGAFACMAMTWMVRRERDWMTLLMPAAVVSSCWTYTQAYSHIMGWFLVYAIVRDLQAGHKFRMMWVLLIFAVVSCSRFPLAMHGLCGFVGWKYPVSEYAFRCVDSLNSTFTLLLTFTYCLIRPKTRL